MLYHFKNLQKPRVILLEPTGISVVNVARTTNHFGKGIKLGSNLVGLNDKSKDALRNTFSEVKFLIKNQLSMVSSDLWRYIDSRLEEIFMMITEKVFAGLAVLTVVDFLQLPQVKEKLNLSQFSDKHSMKNSLGLQL